MKLREKERLARQFLQKRDTRVAQAEADYKREMDALEIIWKSAREDQEQPAEAFASPATVKEPRAITGRSTGVRKAIRDAIAEHTGDFNTVQIFEKVKVSRPDVKRQTVADALSRMANNGEIDPVTAGVGRRPAVYRQKKQETQETLTLEPVGHESEGLPM